MLLTVLTLFFSLRAERNAEKRWHIIKRPSWSAWLVLSVSPGSLEGTKMGTCLWTLLRRIPLPLSYAPDYDDLCNGPFSKRSRKFTVYFNFNNVSIFHMSKKLLRSIYDTEFSNMRSFIRICRKLMNIWDLKLANFLQNLVWSIERRGYISLKEKKNGKV